MIIKKLGKTIGFSCAVDDKLSQLFRKSCEFNDAPIGKTVNHYMAVDVFMTDEDSGYKFLSKTEREYVEKWL